MNDADTRVEVVVSLEQLKLHKVAYQQLIDEINSINVLVYTLDWLETMYPIYNNLGSSLYFLLIWQEESLIGVAPFQLEKKSLSRGGLRRIYFLGDIEGNLNNYLGDFLIPNKNNIAICIKALKHHLYVDGRGDWDYIELEYFSEKSIAFQVFDKNFSEANKKLCGMKTFVIEEQDGFSKYKENIKKKLLKELRRRERKLREENNNVQIACVSEISGEILCKIKNLHSKRQKYLIKRGDSRHRLFDNKTESKLFEMLLGMASAKGLLRCYYISVGEELVAFVINFCDKNGVLLYLSAFDDQYSQYSPARLVRMFLFESELDKYGVNYINMLPGETKIKNDFSTNKINNWNFIIINNNFLSYGRYYIWKLAQLVKKTIKIFRQG